MSNKRAVPAWCPHGVRLPFECKECLYAVTTPAKPTAGPSEALPSEAGGADARSPEAEERRCVDCERPLAQSDMDPDPHKRCWRNFRFAWPVTQLSTAAEIGCLTAAMHLWKNRARAAESRGAKAGLLKAAKIARGVYLENLDSKNGVREEIALQIERHAQRPPGSPSVPAAQPTEEQDCGLEHGPTGCNMVAAAHGLVTQSPHATPDSVPVSHRVAPDTTGEKSGVRAPREIGVGGPSRADQRERELVGVICQCDNPVHQGRRCAGDDQPFRDCVWCGAMLCTLCYDGHACEKERQRRAASDEPRAAPSPALPREAPEPGAALTEVPCAAQNYGHACDLEAGHAGQHCAENAAEGGADLTWIGEGRCGAEFAASEPPLRCGRLPGHPSPHTAYVPDFSYECRHAVHWPSDPPRAAPSDSAPATPGLRSLVEQARDLIGVYAPDETILLGRLTAAIARLDAAPATPGLGPPSAGSPEEYGSEQCPRDGALFIRDDGVDRCPRCGGGRAQPPRAAGIAIIAAERKRQIEVERWSEGHDDEHDGGEIAIAAACYALPKKERVPMLSGGQPALWPWDRMWWKPGPTRIRELAKAGALIAAEIDRLQRASGEPRVAPSSPEDTQKNTLRAATSGTSNPEER